MERLTNHIITYLRQTRGASAIEFAIVLPVYLLFLFGIIEFGYIFWGYATLEYGTSYGARYAYVHPTSSSSTLQTVIGTATADFPGTLDFSGTTITANVSATINGTFTYTFFGLPIAPVTMTANVVQPLPPPV